MIGGGGGALTLKSGRPQKNKMMYGKPYKSSVSSRNFNRLITDYKDNGALKRGWCHWIR